MKSIFKKLVNALGWMFSLPTGVRIPYSYMRGHSSAPMYYFNKKGGTEIDRSVGNETTGSK
jgi:hypothetical protein